MRSARIGLFAIAALLACAMASGATGWWNGDWAFRKSITVRLPEAAGGGLPSRLVVPIRLHAGNFQYFQDMQAGAADLRFLTDDGAPLSYQLELVDPVAGLLVAWVEVPVKPDVPPRPIWMYYGNPRATKPQDAALYDADQAVVFHFAEAQGMPRDATANHFDAGESNAHANVPGVIGSGIQLDGRGLVRLGARPSLAIAPGGGMTFATWVRLDSESPRAVLYLQADGRRHVEIGVAGTRLYTEIVDDQHTTRVESASPLSIGKWQHVVVTLGTQIALYVDGAPAGQAPAANGLPAISGDVFIGGGNSSEVAGLTGQLDEVEISRAARSAWWARATALGQAAESTLVDYGADESKDTSGKFAAYFAMMRNLLGQVSLDGLVVITITALMGLASAQVLVSKAGMLRRTEQQDARFLEEFAARFQRDVDSSAVAAGAGPGVEGEGYEASGIHDMYRAGFQALESVYTARGTRRLTQCLSGEAFEAIRAGLDAALVAATDRLNSRLVLMTVAIAGAPFMGLLGTVVGVMITFASIAAAGDVNVNTIAPGVAAAMTATVVGLLVAIPTLFGYNWLATRIGRRTAAMEVFADQFISRLALLGLAAGSRTPEEDVRRAVHAA